VKYNTLKHIS